MTKYKRIAPDSYKVRRYGPFKQVLENRHRTYQYTGSRGTVRECFGDDRVRNDKHCVYVVRFTSNEIGYYNDYYNDSKVLLPHHQDAEDFIKVGVSKQTLCERFHGLRYDLTILGYVEFGTKAEAHALEKELKLATKEFLYIPTLEFGGSKTECRTLDSFDTINEIIKPYEHTKED